jgi:FkbM family methyltransferase
MPDYKAAHYSIKSQLIAKISQACSGLTYTSRRGLTAGLRRKGGLGFLPIRQEPTAEDRFLASLDLRDKVVYDLGGYQGLMTTFFARSARQVITYEANPINVARISENTRLNNQKNVLIRNAAIGAVNGILRFKCDRLMTGWASGDPELQLQMGDSSAIEEWSVVQTTLDGDVEAYGLPIPDFVKIDIEGMELAALQGMCHVLRNAPALFIEIHGANLEQRRANCQRVVEHLRDFCYWARDIERDRVVDAGGVTGEELHLYCEVAGKLVPLLAPGIK